jgi:hypothetical protein
LTLHNPSYPAAGRGEVLEKRMSFAWTTTFAKGHTTVQ